MRHANRKPNRRDPGRAEDLWLGYTIFAISATPRFILDLRDGMKTAWTAGDPFEP
jgi:hypothetical protein